MRADNVHDPMWGQGGNAEDNEERYHVFFIGLYFVGPFIEAGFPFWQGEECGPEGGRDEITESGSRGNATADEGKCACDTPDCATKDGEVH